jgi:hypothetical protein
MENEWKCSWKSKTVDEFLALRDQMREVLSAKLSARKKAALKRRLKLLNQRSNNSETTTASPTLICLVRRATQYRRAER